MKKIALLSLVAVTLIAAEAKKEKKAPAVTAFMTHTELSYVQTQGNTNTNAFSLDFNGKQKIHNHSIKLDIDALYGDEESVENKNSLISELNYDYQFAKHFTINYLVGYKNDKFSGFDYQLYTGPGAKYIAIDNKKRKLDFQLNVLYSVDDTMDKYYDPTSGDEIKYPYPDGTTGANKVDGDAREYTGYVAKLNYNCNILEGLKFVQELSYRGDFEEQENYFVFSKTAFESKISDLFSMGISYKVDYVNVPPAGNEYSDRTFMTSLIIDY